MAGEFQFIAQVPASAQDCDQPVTAAHNGSLAQTGTFIAAQH